MNYDDHLMEFNDLVTDPNFEEPDCSPHPLDVMAITALYSRVPKIGSTAGPGGK